MQEVQFGDQVVRFDRHRTRTAYSAIPMGDPERCGCSYCINFAAQRPSAYPADFRSLLEQIGIDPEKEGEVYEAGREGDLRTYGGWFYFAGEVVKRGEHTLTEASGFQYWFVDAKRLPKTVVDFGESVAAVEFVTRLPWLPAGPPD